MDTRPRAHSEAELTALEFKQAFDVSEAQQKMAEPVVQKLLEANALLRKAKKIEKE